MSRRALLAGGAAGGAAMALRWARIADASSTAPAAVVPRLAGAHIPRFRVPLPLPAKAIPAAERDGFIRYDLAARSIRQQVLPPGLPRTWVFGYGVVGHPGTFGWPGPTFEHRAGTPARVRWRNQLVDRRGRFVPHLLPVDATLHWANPPGGIEGRDRRPDSPSAVAYDGPVPIVTHVHGTHTHDDSDGYPEAWYLADMANLPSGYARNGTWYGRFKGQAEARSAVPWAQGTAVFDYPNDQRAACLWYHDHTLGMTRANVYAGLAGLWFLRGGPSDLPRGVLPGPAAGDTTALRHDLADTDGAADGHSARPYELPIVIQDRSFRRDGSLAYPASRAEFDGFTGPYRGDPDRPSDVAPIWNPEVFGDTICVNGATWPYATVEPRRYRLRLLNGCDARTLILRMEHGLPIWQVGNDGGLLPAPVAREQLVLMPSMRADVVVDFSALAGRSVLLLNVGPDEPYGGGAPDVDFTRAPRATTGTIMRFDVAARTMGPDTSTPPEELSLPTIAALGPASRRRAVVIAEFASWVLDAGGGPLGDGDEAAGPVCGMLGVLDDHGAPVGMMWSSPVTEAIELGATEEWEIHNYTEDAHPVHLHQTQFEVLGRGEDGTTPPAPHERGRQDVVIALPGEVTRIKARFDLPGQFEWHCHIVEHEDNEMMRPITVGPVTPPRPPDGPEGTTVCVIGPKHRSG